MPQTSVHPLLLEHLTKKIKNKKNKGIKKPLKPISLITTHKTK